MKVLDGRNHNTVPHVIEIPSFLITEKWEAEDGTCIYCLQLDGELVACVSTRTKEYSYTLCASYKTARGFEAWRNRFYPLARKVA